MKKQLSVILLVVMMILLTLSACNQNVLNETDEVYAQFGSGDKSLSYSYEIPEYEDLYWRYSAYKTDSYGTKGATWDGVSNEVFMTVPTGSTVATKGLDGVVGPFSQGKWVFKLEAYSSCESVSGNLVFSGLVYEGSTETTLYKNHSNYIAITVSPSENSGKIRFDNAYFCFDENGSGTTETVDMKITVSGAAEVVYTETLHRDSSGKYYIQGNSEHLFEYSNGSETTTAVPAGTYLITVDILDSATSESLYTFAEQTLAIKIYGGITTIISGDLTEELSENNYFTTPDSTVVSKKTESNGSVSFTAQTSPAAESSTTLITTAQCPEGSLTGDTQYDLTVKVVSHNYAEAHYHVLDSSSNTEAAVAGLGLKIVETGSTDSTHVNPLGNDNYATVTTYIQSGITGQITVVCTESGAEQPRVDSSKERGASGCNTAAVLSSDSGLGYNPLTGYLSFETKSISEYYVKTAVQAYIEETGRYYPTLSSAIDAVLENQTITLLTDYTVPYGPDYGTESSVSTETSFYSHYNPLLITKDNVTLNLNEKKILSYRKYSFGVAADGVTVKNGYIDGETISGLKGVPTDAGLADDTGCYPIVVNNCNNVTLSGLVIHGGIAVGGDSTVISGTQTYTPNAGPATNVIIENCEIIQYVTEAQVCVLVQNGSTATINGNLPICSHEAAIFKATGSSSTLTVESGFHVGNLIEENGGEILLKGGSYNHDVSAFVAPGYKVVQEYFFYSVVADN